MGLIHLDAGVIIGLLDGEDAHHEAARRALDHALRSGDRLAMAASALAECLFGPSRRGEPEVQVVRDLVARLPVSIEALDADSAGTAARLRARHTSLRLPDALVLATAIDAPADALVTTDRRWPSARVLKVALEIRQL